MKKSTLILFSTMLLGVGAIHNLSAQAFTRAYELASAYGMASTGIARPDMHAGVLNEAAPAFSTEKFGVFAGVALPYGVKEIKMARAQVYYKINPTNGFSLDVSSIGIEGYGEKRVNLGYCRKLAAKLAIGAAFEFDQVTATEYDGKNGFTFSVGFMSQPFKSVYFGGRIRNPFHQKIGNEPIPALFQAGLGWKVSEVVQLLAETEKSNERPAQFKAGVEYFILKSLALRVGMRSNPARISFGAGWHLKNGIRLDMASEYHSILGITPAVSGSYSF